MGYVRSWLKGLPRYDVQAERAHLWHASHVGPIEAKRKS
jgi:hypothetical protein